MECEDDSLEIEDSTESLDEDRLDVDVEGRGCSVPSKCARHNEEWIPYESKVHFLLSVLCSSKTHRVVSFI